MKPILLAPPRRLVAAAGLALVLAAAGCGGRDPSPPTSVVPPAAATPAGTPPTATSPATTPVAVPPTTAPTSSRPAPTDRPTPPALHFTTPQAAMRYLAAAYNRHDVPAMKKVTNASARTALIAMYREASNLQLTGCSRRDIGDYVCSFRHDYPEHMHRSGHGEATFLAAPADKPGWYMTVLVDCG